MKMQKEQQKKKTEKNKCSMNMSRSILKMLIAMKFKEKIQAQKLGN